MASDYDLVTKLLGQKYYLDVTSTGRFLPVYAVCEYIGRYGRLEYGAKKFRIQGISSGT